MKTIPVVFTPDKNYIIPTSVAIISMLKTKKTDTRYLFYIIIADDAYILLHEYMEKIKINYPTFEYKIIIIDHKRFDCLEIHTQHLSVSAFYLLSLPELLNEDVCMYHDGDILVKEDLSCMMDLSINNYYLAGIKNIHWQQNNIENQKHFIQWGNMKNDKYIFSGDLVFNLKKIRDDKLYEKFYKEMQKGYLSEDQDILNKCCYEGITFLPLKYCMLSRWLNRKSISKYEKQIYEKKELNEAYTAPAIIHFAGYVKPWNNLRTIGSEEWWNIAKEILKKNEYIELRKKAKENTVINDWNYFMSTIADSPIVIVGCGHIGKGIAECAEKWNCNIKCFADNNRNLHGSIINNINVYSYEQAASLYPDAKWIVTIINDRNIIIKQIKELKIEDSKIYIQGKYKSYYQALNPLYYDVEIRDILYREKIEGYNYMTFDEIVELVKSVYYKEWNNKYFLEYWLI